MADKTSLRHAWQEAYAKISSRARWGQAAEKLRSLEPYRKAATVFATPGPSLLQARINCLVDGKNLVMPAPSLRDGFFLLPARSVPFRELTMAVTLKGLVKQGRLLKADAFPSLAIGLLLTDSLTVDLEGGRLGDGEGFFDLSCSLLYELGALQEGWTAWTFILEELLSPVPLPMDPWDVQLAGAITPAVIHPFAPSPRKPKIFWDVLSRDRIRRIDPLWKLFSAQVQQT